MWFVDAVVSGFRSDVPDAEIQIYRMLLGAACVVKAVEGFLHGGWSMVRPGSYNAFRVQRKVPAGLRSLAVDAYRPVLVIRLVASLGLTAGVVPNSMAAVVAATMLYDLLWLYKSNTAYLALCCAALVFAGRLSGFGTTHSASSANTWAQFLVVLITIDMYWNTAWLKARSLQFRSGLILPQWIDAADRVKDRLPYREYWFPALLVRGLARYSVELVTFWKSTSVIVVALEILLPPALFYDATHVPAVVVGIAMHIGFTLLLPRKLLPFGIASAASYALF